MALFQALFLLMLISYSYAQSFECLYAPVSSNEFLFNSQKYSYSSLSTMPSTWVYSWNSSHIAYNPSLSASSVLLFNDFNSIRALNASTGLTMYSHTASSDYHPLIFYIDGNPYYFYQYYDNANSIYYRVARNLLDNSLLWTVSRFWSYRPTYHVSSDELLFVELQGTAAGGGSIEGISSATGNTLWNYTFDTGLIGTSKRFTYNSGFLHLLQNRCSFSGTGCTDLTLNLSYVRLNASTGAVVLDIDTTLRNRSIKTNIISSGETIYFAAGPINQPTQADTIYAFDTSTGTFSWTLTPGDRITYLAYDPALNYLYAVNSSGLLAISASSGSILWSFQRVNNLSNPVLSGNMRLAIGDTSGFLSVLDSQTGDLIWNASLFLPVYFITLAGNNLYVTTNTTLFAFCSAPVVYNPAYNSTTANKPSRFSAEIYHPQGVSGYIFSVDLGTGSFTNLSWTSVLGTNVTADTVLTLPNEKNASIRFRVYANDTLNRWHASELVSFLTTDYPPYFNLSTVSWNTSVYNSSVLFSVRVFDDSELSHFVFSIDNCQGTFTNFTYQFSDSSGWANVTHLIAPNGNCTVRFRFYANDSGNQWNSTPEYSFDTDDPPVISNLTTSSNLSGSFSTLSAFITDDVSLSGYIFSFDNGTGSFVNSSWTPLAGNAYSFSTSVLLNSTPNSTIRWVLYANDSSNSWRASQTVVFNTTAYPPRYNITTLYRNTSLAGASARFSILWLDDLNLSGYIFSFDNCTGVFVNDSFIGFSGTSNISTAEKVLNSTLNCTIRFQFHANDSSNLWNSTPVFSFQTGNYPIVSNLSTNSTTANSFANLSASISDVIGLSGYIFSFDNGTGSFVNSSWTPIPTNPFSFSIIVLLNSAVNSMIRFKLYVNNTGNDWTESEAFSFTTTEFAPSWVEGSAYYNSSLAGSDVQFSLNWTDDLSLSHYVFSIDNCIGSFVNLTPVSFSGTSNVSRSVFTINSTSGCTVRYRFYANDSRNQWNASDVFSFQTGRPPVISDLSHNSTYAGHPVMFSASLSDETLLSGYIFSFDNGTGSFVNSSWVQVNNISYSFSAVLWVNQTNNSFIRFRLYANDSDGIWAFSEVSFRTLASSPQYINHTANHNSTKAGSDVQFSLNWTDDLSLSHYVFSIDNCIGSFVNLTPVSFSGTSNVSRSVFTINNTSGCPVRYMFYANDSSGMWNASDVYLLITTSSEVPETYGYSFRTNYLRTNSVKATGPTAPKLILSKSLWFTAYDIYPAFQSFSDRKKVLLFNGTSIYRIDYGLETIYENVLVDNITALSSSGKYSYASANTRGYLFEDASPVFSSGVSQRNLLYDVIEKDLSIYEAWQGSDILLRNVIVYLPNGPNYLIWNTTFSGQQVAPLISDGSHIYLFTQNSLRKLTSEGTLIFTYPLESDQFTDKAFLNGNTLYFATAGNYLYSLNVSSLQENWIKHYVSSTILNIHRWGDRIVVIYRNAQNQVFAEVLNPDKTIYTSILIPYNYKDSLVAESNGMLYYLAHNGSLYAYGLASGTLVFSISSNSGKSSRLGFEPEGIILVVGSRLFVIGNSGTSELITFDNSPPVILSTQYNSSLAGSPVLITANFSDDNSLSGYQIAYDNCTGSFVFTNWKPLSGRTNSTADVLVLNNTVGCTFRYKFYVNDSMNEWLITEPYEIDVEGQEAVPPSYSSPTVSTNLGRSNATFSITFQDNSKLSGYIFSFDNCTGTFYNDSFVPLSGKVATVNHYKYLPPEPLCQFRYRFYVNDTSNNMVSTPLYEFFINLLEVSNSETNSVQNLSVISNLSATFSYSANTTLPTEIVLLGLRRPGITNNFTYYPITWKNQSAYCSFDSISSCSLPLISSSNITYSDFTYSFVPGNLDYLTGVLLDTNGSSIKYSLNNLNLSSGTLLLKLILKHDPSEAQKRSFLAMRKKDEFILISYDNSSIIFDMGNYSIGKLVYSCRLPVSLLNGDFLRIGFNWSFHDLNSFYCSGITSEGLSAQASAYSYPRPDIQLGLEENTLALFSENFSLVLDDLAIYSSQNISFVLPMLNASLTSQNSITVYGLQDGTQYDFIYYIRDAEPFMGASSVADSYSLLYTFFTDTSKRLKVMSLLVNQSCTLTQVYATNTTGSRLSGVNITIYNPHDINSYIFTGITDSSGSVSFDSSELSGTYGVSGRKQGYVTAYINVEFACKRMDEISRICGEGLRLCPNGECMANCCNFNGICEDWELCDSCTDCSGSQRCCKDLSQPCFSDADCCSGLVCGFANKCIAKGSSDTDFLSSEVDIIKIEVPNNVSNLTLPTSCKAYGSLCNSDEECCKGLCENNVCTMCTFNNQEIVERSLAAEYRQKGGYECTSTSSVSSASEQREYYQGSCKRDSCSATKECCEGYCYRGSCVSDYAVEAFEDVEVPKSVSDTKVYDLIAVVALSAGISLMLYERFGILSILPAIVLVLLEFFVPNLGLALANPLIFVVAIIRAVFL